MIDLNEAIRMAKQRWPSQPVRGDSAVDEGWAEQRGRLCAVGIRRVTLAGDDIVAVQFSTKGFGKTFEEAFKNAGKEVA